MAHIRLNNIYFSYPVYSITGRSLKVSLMQQVAGAQIRNSNETVTVTAIKNLSFELKDGDRLGLVGHNGAGKSSLLRVLAGLAHPQAGSMEIQGRVIPLIERALGVNQELSGYDNIELPLRLLGANDQEIKEARGYIPEFTGLGDFMSLPVRTYSEGMKARLAFALCTAIHGDIMILDEWLSAGDIDFVEKAEQRLTNMVDSVPILVLASHNLDLLRRVCTKVAWMAHGKLMMLGDPEEVLTKYAEHH